MMQMHCLLGNVKISKKIKSNENQTTHRELKDGCSKTNKK